MHRDCEEHVNAAKLTIELSTFYIKNDAFSQAVVIVLVYVSHQYYYFYVMENCCVCVCVCVC